MPQHPFRAFIFWECAKDSKSETERNSLKEHSHDRPGPVCPQLPDAARVILSPATNVNSVKPVQDALKELEQNAFRLDERVDRVLSRNDLKEETSALRYESSLLHRNMLVSAAAVVNWPGHRQNI